MYASVMRRIVPMPCLALFAALVLPAPLGAAPTAPAERDDVAAVERSVVRVVTVAVVNGEVVGFGHGSGFAVAPNRIVTNAHVVGDAEEFPNNVIIGIVPSEGTRSYPGRLIRIDRARDLALIEMVEGRVPPASVYTGPVAARTRVFALGYPGNVDVATARAMDDFIRPRTPLASDGIISARDAVRGVEALVHDADIARGNSGGPLVDGCGRVIGVNAFISRADDGDSPFSFAVSVRELAAFLRQAQQRFTGVAANCLSAADIAARDGAADAESRRLAALAAQRAEAAGAARAQELERLRGAAGTRRENVMALAAALLGLAVLAGSAAISFAGLKRQRDARIAAIAGGALALAALLAFLLRPDPRDVALPAPAAAGSNVAGPATERAVGYGALTCTVARERGRLTLSDGADTALTIDNRGCVNGRTQYVAASGGRWFRTLVPNEDATVSRISYDPASGDYVVRRYLLSLGAIQAARAQRASAEVRGCGGSAEGIARLTAREAAIAALLPARPNEEIVSECRVDTAAAR